jgi:hypothetical protein
LASFFHGAQLLPAQVKRTYDGLLRRREGEPFGRELQRSDMRLQMMKAMLQVNPADCPPACSRCPVPPLTKSRAGLGKQPNGLRLRVCRRCN